MERDVYSGYVKLYGKDARDTLSEVINLALSLRKAGKKPEAKELLRANSPVADRVFGCEHCTSLRIRWLYANSLRDDASPTLSDLVEAEATLKSVLGSWRRVMGAAHPETANLETAVVSVRRELARARAASGA